MRGRLTLVYAIVMSSRYMIPAQKLVNDFPRLHINSAMRNVEFQMAGLHPKIKVDVEK